MKNVSFNMEPLLRRWKLLALKYKREATAIHEKITENYQILPDQSNVFRTRSQPSKISYLQNEGPFPEKYSE